MPLERRLISIRGLVQGVGFRPFAHRLAAQLQLSGWVANHSGSVEIELQGPPSSIERYITLLQKDLPPLAIILSLSSTSIPPISAESSFEIRPSAFGSGASAPIPPDIATCPECLAELRNPADRRFLYPFLNCTNCGPRFTIIDALPYDRPRTAMAGFPLCPDCLREYQNPADRRFHAQPIACPACGPQLSSSYFRQALRAGQILAVKGIGGFHLACDALDDHVVSELRRRKQRQNKPFAVMVRDLEEARLYARISPAEARTLTSPRRPIVLLSKGDRPLAPSVAPGHARLGLFLPYSPLHHLLVEDGPLVMTSGNLSDEPICRTNEEALSRLAGIADHFVLHNRDIRTVCDDSVVQIFRDAEMPLRRSRGYTPFPISLPCEAPPILAVGGELKSTFCLTQGDQAYLSQHLGDMANLETLEAFERALSHFNSLLQISPQVLVCDKHPDYLSTRWAHRQAEQPPSLPLFPVQHHHAHFASVLCENNVPLDEETLAVLWDGTGYGDDGTIWGGEFFAGGYSSYRRLAHLKPLPLPGGDAAIRHPQRTLAAWMYASGIPFEISDLLRHQLDRRLNCILCSSAGRLFDALAALCGFTESSYEAQAAMELEAVATLDDLGTYPCELDPAPLLAAVLADRLAGRPVSEISTVLHRSLAGLIARTSERLSQETGLRRVALSGGVFQNRTLLELTMEALTMRGLEPLIHRFVPPNDGGLSLGQAAVYAAAARKGMPRTANASTNRSCTPSDSR